jgi:hypothetical protein
LARWTIFVASPEREQKILMGNHAYGLVRRTPTGNSSIGVLVEPRHEGVDLPGGPNVYRKGESFNTLAMRTSRAATNGLLLIYPLDPTPFHVTADAIIALAASLPKTMDEDELFVVNSGVPNG